MKSTGIVRKVDELGRVVLPIELRRNMGIEIKDSLEIFVDENTIILQKYEPADIFTGSMDDLIDYKGKKVSKASILEMARIAGLRTHALADVCQRNAIGPRHVGQAGLAVILGDLLLSRCFLMLRICKLHLRRI